MNTPDDTLVTQPDLNVFNPSSDAQVSSQFVQSVKRRIYTTIYFVFGTDLLIFAFIVAVLGVDSIGWTSTAQGTGWFIWVVLGLVALRTILLVWARLAPLQVNRNIAHSYCPTRPTLTQTGALRFHWPLYVWAISAWISFGIVVVFFFADIGNVLFGAGGSSRLTLAILFYAFHAGLLILTLWLVIRQAARSVFLQLKRAKTQYNARDARSRRPHAKATHVTRAQFIRGRQADASVLFDRNGPDPDLAQLEAFLHDGLEAGQEFV